MAHPPVDPPLSIVRIKRKLNSSTNGFSPPSSSQSMRNGPEALMLAEPLKKRTRLDSAQPKDPKAAQPFFTFAETVPASSFDSPQISEALRARLKALVHSQSTSPGPLELSKEQEHASSSELSQQREQYHVVAKTRGRDFDLVDVEANNSSRKRRKAGNAKTRKAENSAKLPDASMEQFNNLLQEYLSLDRNRDISESIAAAQESLPTTSSSRTPTIALPANEETDSDDSDYVYDIYYRTANPSTQAFIPDSWAEVTGMDASDLEKGVSDDSSEGGEAVGEVDPDSNDEGFYANDYPDEEDFSDGFSERISSDADSSDGDGSGWER